MFMSLSGLAKQEPIRETVFGQIKDVRHRHLNEFHKKPDKYTGKTPEYVLKQQFAIITQVVLSIN